MSADFAVVCWVDSATSGFCVNNLPSADSAAKAVAQQIAPPNKQAATVEADANNIRFMINSGEGTVFGSSLSENCGRIAIQRV